MASLRKRGNHWQARVALKHGPTVAKTFPSKQLAREWALSQQYENLKTDSVKTQTPDPHVFPCEEIFADLLKRYAKDVSPQKKGCEVEQIRIEALLKRDLANLRLANLTSAAVACYRDARLKEVKADTVRREFNLLRHVWSVAHREWGLVPKDNPFEGLRMPKASPHRERTLTGDEWERLKRAAQTSSHTWLFPMLVLAYSTGLRRSELLALHAYDVDLSQGDLKVRDSKSGHARLVFFNPTVATVLEPWVKTLEGGDRIFPVSIYALRYAFEQALKRAEINNFRWHDLRHCATSRLAERGLTSAELMALTGHRQLASLARYTHLSCTHLRKRIEDLGL